MADRINFEKKLNDSVQIGDELWYSDISSGTPSTPQSAGTITTIGEKHVIVDTISPGLTASNTFFMFRKPVEQNISSLKGYFSEVTLTNSSTTKQELFAVGSEVSVSSK
tara:strand:- start:533 stop:859 length:327 start_codon:yes stop_codon:yes gene_type:complete